MITSRRQDDVTNGIIQLKTEADILNQIPNKGKQMLPVCGTSIRVNAAFKMLGVL